ncbi:MAG: RNA 2',3'-cyclic phosphodiesterase, partial [Candidatus Omnitrophica bacterium]|nr:RNA 2',3'-cyclic phosphodiesterase [Candidatus Omnitrophota bacterium]
IHMTVKFLGETREELLSGIKTTLKQVSAGHAALHAQLTEFGFFPDTRRPRIFYIGTDNELALRNIAYEIEENLEVLGFKQENRFRAHLTLARFKSDHNLPRFHEKLKSVKVTGTIPVTALGLVKSTLSRTGPTYETLWETPLKNY